MAQVSGVLFKNPSESELYLPNLNQIDLSNFIDMSSNDKLLASAKSLANAALNLCRILSNHISWLSWLIIRGSRFQFFQFRFRFRDCPCLEHDYKTILEPRDSVFGFQMREPGISVH